MIICLDILEAKADFFQDEANGSIDIEGELLVSGDFIFYWDDGPNRKMVKTNNIGHFIQSGFVPRNTISGESWKEVSQWMNAPYEVRNFRGYDYVGKCSSALLPRLGAHPI